MAMSNNNNMNNKKKTNMTKEDRSLSKTTLALRIFSRAGPFILNSKLPALSAIARFTDAVTPCCCMELYEHLNMCVYI